MTYTEIINQIEWNTLVHAMPDAHILQSWQWGAFKQTTIGWQPRRLVWRDADGEAVALASVLERGRAPFRVLYIPRGPLLNYADNDLRKRVFDDLQAYAKQRGAVWLKIDPALPLALGLPDSDDPDRPDRANPIGQLTQRDLELRGWQFSGEQVQFRNTMVLDLTQSEDDLLADMSQGTRRKIRKADKAGVTIRVADIINPASDDLKTLYDFYNTTGDRQDFLIRPLSYYREAWTTFVQAGQGIALLAELDGEPLSGMVLFHIGDTAWYFYGMSSNQHRDAQPNYALQWYAIRWAKAQGLTVYDWWGAPNEFTEEDPMWGVYRFKDGFGGDVVRTLGAWDYTPAAWKYKLFTWGVPKARSVLKALKRT